METRMIENPKNPLKTKKPRKSRAGSSLKTVNLQRAEKKLLNILDRQINKLLTISVSGLFSKDESLALVNYVKLLKQIQKDDNQDLDKMTDEELEKLASK